jgi:hypothetical protein
LAVDLGETLGYRTFLAGGARAVEDGPSGRHRAAAQVAGGEPLPRPHQLADAA